MGDSVSDPGSRSLSKSLLLQCPEVRCSGKCPACELFDRVKTESETWRYRLTTVYYPEPLFESISRDDMEICRVQVTANTLSRLIKLIEETPNCEQKIHLGLLRAFQKDRKILMKEMEEALRLPRLLLDMEARVKAHGERVRAHASLNDALLNEAREDGLLSDAKKKLEDLVRKHGGPSE